MHIRFAQKKDLAGIESLICAAFPDGERETITRLVGDIITASSSPFVMPYLAEIEAKLSGFVAFTPVKPIENTAIQCSILAPLAVHPDVQKMGVGTKLINHGKSVLIKNKVDVLLVYGDPQFYGRFGFHEEIARPFAPPFPLTYPFGWLGMELQHPPLSRRTTKISCIEALSQPDMW